MTCIIGCEDRNTGSVFIGADSAGVSGYLMTRTALEKVFRLDKFLIGYTSSFRMGQLLQYRLDVPTQKEGVGDLKYMATAFVNAVRVCLKTGGYTRVENNREEGGSFLVGYKGHLYGVDRDFQVNRTRDGVDAAGAGREIALGAMRALENLVPMSGTRIFHALEAAEYYSTVVTAPFTVLELK